MCMDWEMWFEALEQRRQQAQAKTPPKPDASRQPQPVTRPAAPVPLDAEPEPV